MIRLGRAMAMLAVVLISSVVGCSQPRYEYGIVTGRITLAGKPMDHVQIIFLPQPERGTNGGRADSFTDAGGQFILSTPKYEAQGAAVGFHKVVFVDITALPGVKGKGTGERTTEVGTGTKPKNPTLVSIPVVNRIPPQYRHMNTTPIEVEVKPGSNTFDFDIK